MKLFIMLVVRDNEDNNDDDDYMIMVMIPQDQAPAGSQDWTEIPIPGFLKIKSRDFFGIW